MVSDEGVSWGFCIFVAHIPSSSAPLPISSKLWLHRGVGGGDLNLGTGFLSNSKILANSAVVCLIEAAHQMCVKLLRFKATLGKCQLVGAAAKHFTV